MSDKQPRTVKPDAIGPVEQFTFLLYASKDTKLTSCDSAVLAEITNQYIKKDIGKLHKAGVTFPVGHTHLVRETGRGIAAVKASLARLLKRGYIAIARAGKGTRGTEYVPNFNWSRTVKAAIDKELDARKVAKANRRRRARGMPHHPTSTNTLEGCSSTPLRDIVGCYTNLLSDVVGCPSTPQTYVEPKGSYIGDAVPAGGLEPPPAVISKKIKSASVESEDGETWLTVEFEERGSDTIALESADKDIQEEGQRELEQLSYSAGLGEIEDAEELVGRTVYMRGGRYVVPPDDMQDAA